MKVVLYSNASDNKKIHKKIYEAGEYDVVWKNGTSIAKPTLVLYSAGDITIENYCYIPELRRYYYVTDTILVKENVYEIQCRVDVLMSYDLRNVRIVKERYQDPIVADSSIPLKSYRKLKYFGGGTVNDGKLDYILVVAGGGN